MYTVTMNELKAVLKVSAQAGQSGAVNKTSVKSMVQDDDFREVKRRKRHNSNDTSQTAKKSTNQSQHQKAAARSQFNRDIVHALVH
jgi:phosphatidate phosphatase PAH1